MIIDDEVRTALETLRRHAQGNDFELYRIDVLERDLTTPPVAEQIDETHQRFDGVTYSKKADGHYSAYKGIHQIIWKYYHGEIPADDVYEIHHRNLNPADNSPDNLQLLTKSEHQKLHNALNRKSQICPICGKVFTPKSPSDKRTFCSHKCRGVSLRKTPVEKICPVCGKKFIAHQQRPHQVCCSDSCAAKLRCQKLGFDLVTGRTCPVCGKDFIPGHNPRQICCSKSCAMKRRHAERRKSLT